MNLVKAERMLLFTDKNFEAIPATIRFAARCFGL